MWPRFGGNLNGNEGGRHFSQPYFGYEDNTQFQNSNRDYNLGSYQKGRQLFGNIRNNRLNEQSYRNNSHQNARQRDYYNHGNTNGSGSNLRTRCNDLNNRPHSSLGIQSMDGSPYSLFSSELTRGKFSMENKKRISFSPEYTNNKNFRRGNSVRNSVERNIRGDVKGADTFIREQGRPRANSCSLIRRTISQPDLTNQKQQPASSSRSGNPPQRDRDKGGKLASAPTPQLDISKKRQEPLKFIDSSNPQFIKKTIHNDKSENDLSQLRQMTFSSSDEDQDDTPSSKKVEQSTTWTNNQTRLPENNKKIKVPKLLETCNWGDSDDEEFRRKTTEEDCNYLYTLDTLPEYDGKTPIGQEGGSIISVHCCNYCSLVYTSKKGLQQHFLTKSHYNKYKTRLNESEVMQMFKKC